MYNFYFRHGFRVFVTMEQTLQPSAAATQLGYLHNAEDIRKDNRRLFLRVEKQFEIVQSTISLPSCCHNSLVVVAKRKIFYHTYVDKFYEGGTAH